MNTVPGTQLCQDQTDGLLNRNCSNGNFSILNECRFENIKPEISSHGSSPKYPQYHSLQSRLITFQQWPLPRPGPLQLAQVGLFYLGTKDRTVCYHCGGGLSAWEQDDDPELEHKRLFPHCELVKRKNQSDNSGSTQCSSQNGPISSLKQDKIREDPMQSAAVQSLLEFGYTIENIKKAMDTLERRMGKSTVDAKKLMEILECSEDAEESNKESPEVESHSKVNSKSLMEENERLRDKTICKICMESDSCIVFLPCGHMVCCVTCAPAMRKCPICRVVVRGTVKAFMA
ncbi:hypothetical protein ACJMK2_029382 [Sinanodonta woodiana]|uniref:RING-type domain-containing protein n=1 Tax=Sinanodonta woodiana TaxID=1069815 RepID=A0ABD3X9Z4_SINWO